MSSPVKLPPILPSRILRLVQEDGPKKNDLEMVVDCLLSPEGTVELTDSQVLLMKQLEEADRLMCSESYTPKEVLAMVIKKLEVSRTVAQRIIDQAQQVYGRARKGNRRYLAQAHVDFLKGVMIKLASAGRMDLIPKLAVAYNDALKLLPEDKEDTRTPTAIVYEFDSTAVLALVPNPPTDKEAYAIAMKTLLDKGLIENIPYTDIPNG